VARRRRRPQAKPATVKPERAPRRALRATAASAGRRQSVGRAMYAALRSRPATPPTPVPAAATPSLDRHQHQHHRRITTAIPMMADANQTGKPSMLWPVGRFSQSRAVRWMIARKTLDRGMPMWVLRACFKTIPGSSTAQSCAIGQATRPQWGRAVAMGIRVVTSVVCTARACGNHSNAHKGYFEV
jgi:hypothetical protein